MKVLAGELGEDSEGVVVVRRKKGTTSSRAVKRDVEKLWKMGISCIFGPFSGPSFGVPFSAVDAVKTLLRLYVGIQEPAFSLFKMVELFSVPTAKRVQYSLTGWHGPALRSKSAVCSAFIR